MKEKAVSIQNSDEVKGQLRAKLQEVGEAEGKLNEYKTLSKSLDEDLAKKETELSKVNSDLKSFFKTKAKKTRLIEQQKNLKDEISQLKERKLEGMGLPTKIRALNSELATLLQKTSFHTDLNPLLMIFTDKNYLKLPMGGRRWGE